MLNALEHFKFSFKKCNPNYPRKNSSKNSLLKKIWRDNFLHHSSTKCCPFQLLLHRTWQNCQKFNARKSLLCFQYQVLLFTRVVGRRVGPRVQWRSARARCHRCRHRAYCRHCPTLTPHLSRRRSSRRSTPRQRLPKFTAPPQPDTPIPKSKILEIE